MNSSANSNNVKALPPRITNCFMELGTLDQSTIVTNKKDINSAPMTPNDKDKNMGNTTAININIECCSIP